ncbi:G1/S-specific cyclin-E1 [Pimephales promelas]|uniref:G1/S-specific cyclin-E1 n=1 Tax=Pimephales promelas TaxID=90988 RepID=UPI001955BAF3|nr:G1/S-specific cyclin-E1 [Pimephales promelas]KAG1955638.1 G1/S-specific cyclin-E2 [Pimephales promelas]KAG1955639.1 G1/S-specific cyclin-E2 [Pimephales promelas]
MPSKKVLRTEQINTTDEAPKTNSVRPRKRKADVAIHLHDLDEEIVEMTRKKSCAPQACWNPDTGYTSPCRRIPTPDEVEEPVAVGSMGFTQYATESIFITPMRSTPLPALCWASKDDVWNNLLRKDKLYLRDMHVMERHPNLQPKMRAILLDWLMEVCEVYKLHRETFYLGQDYFDRFMATQENVLKTTLQLVGISCLFIAAKMEEIYPPKVHQFAYVTDGACSEDDILNMEIIIMKELNWSLSPLTPVAWLNIYMQMAYLKETAEVLIAQYPQATFAQIAELLDLCVLDARSLEFSYSLIAASALFHFSSLELVMKVSGLKWCDLEQCVRWMVPFAMSIREAGSSALKTFKGIAADDMHNIQTHVAYLEWLGKAHSYQQVDIESSQRSPIPSGVLTPPHSSEKPENTVS